MIPYLHLNIDMGIIQIRTSLIYKEFTLRCFEFVSLKITIFYKWGFSFCFYSPDKFRYNILKDK